MNRIIKILFSLLLSLGLTKIYSQQLIVQPSFSVGNDSREFGFVERSKRSNGAYRYISSDIVRTMNSKIVSLEFKYIQSKLFTKRISFYPKIFTGFCSNTYKFNYTDTKWQHTTNFKFNDNSFINSLLLGAEFSPRKIKEYSFFVEAGLCYNSCLNKTDSLSLIYNEGDVFFEEYLTVRNSNNLGSIIKVGANLSLNKRSSLFFGISRLSSLRHRYNYYINYDVYKSGGYIMGDNNNLYLETFPRNHFYYFNFGYQFKIGERKK